MGGFLLKAGAAALAVACAGCAGPSDEDAAARDEPVQVTLKITSFTREVSVGWSVSSQVGPLPTPEVVSPPWSTVTEAEPGARVFLGVANGNAACEILVDGTSVVKQHSTLTGEGAECEYTVG